MFKYLCETSVENQLFDVLWLNDISLISPWAHECPSAFVALICRSFALLLIFLYQKGGKETILEEEFEFKGIEEEEEEESFIDMERNSAEGDKEKGEERLNVFNLLIRLQLPIDQNLNSS